MKLDIFNEFQKVKDDKNPFSDHFIIEEGCDFYIEPAFYTQLKGFEDRHSQKDFNLILERMIEVVKKNKKVVFVGNFEYPQTDVENYIFLEITDITDPLQIFVEDKSRGSDYGD